MLLFLLLRIVPSSLKNMRLGKLKMSFAYYLRTAHLGNVVGAERGFAVKKGKGRTPRFKNQSCCLNIFVKRGQEIVSISICVFPFFLLFVPYTFQF